VPFAPPLAKAFARASLSVPFPFCANGHGAELDSQDYGLRAFVFEDLDGKVRIAASSSLSITICWLDGRALLW
jgi:hypothetical protein